MTTYVTHIVPALPPTVNGLGDYALLLAGGMDDHGVASRFVVGGIAPPSDPGWTVSGRLAEMIAAPTPEALVHAVERAGSHTVLLHFSGYGYARWGLCFWLAEGLARWKSRARNRRLVTMFHELYASGPPWRTSFWTSWPQRRIAFQIATLSDQLVCGYMRTWRQLSQWFPSKRVEILPVFSNVGEISSPLALADRRPWAVVFGGIPRRQDFYRVSSRANSVLNLLSIEYLLDVGRPMDLPDRIGPAAVRKLGQLPPKEISEIMAQSRVGLANYFLDKIASSGILASYHSHGMLCANVSTGKKILDNVQEGVHFVGCRSLRLGVADPQRIATAGHVWYSRHDRLYSTIAFARLCAGDPRDGVSINS